MQRLLIVGAALFGLLLLGVAGFMFMQSGSIQAENDQMQEMNLRMQGIDPDAPSKRRVRVILTTGDCSTDANLGGEFFSGLTAVAYCEDPNGEFHPRLEQTCFAEGLRQAGNDAPLKKHFVELACGIARSYPESTEDWDDNDLNDGLRTLINDYLSTD